ncbi:hypothetical protein [Mucilaginibacter sp. SMC90]
MRTDRYGESISNRAKLQLEVVDACIPVFSAGCIGIPVTNYFC